MVPASENCPRAQEVTIAVASRTSTQMSPRSRQRIPSIA